MKRINFSFTSVYIIIIASLISTILSEETDTNCQLLFENGDEVRAFEWEYGVSLPEFEDSTKPGTNIVKYKYKNIENINDVSSPAKNYLNVYRDEEYFFIELNDKFADYEKYETITRFEIKVKFDCKNNKTREIVFSVGIKDTNNHAPEFLNAPYKFNVPMPIPMGYDFEQLSKITARDIDLTNDGVTFAFKNDENNKLFSISSNERQEKDYPAKFVALDTLDLEKDVTLVLYVTDSGVPRLTTNTTITITVDKGNSAPRFSHALYTADHTNVSHEAVKEMTVNFSQGIITLERGYEGVRDFEITGVPEENKKHLKLTHSDILQRKNNIELQLKLVDVTEEFLSQGVLSLIVKAIKDKVTAETALQILLPEVKNNSYTTEQPKSEEKTIPEDDSKNGFMISTIVLALLVAAGIVGGVIYLFINRKE